MHLKIAAGSVITKHSFNQLDLEFIISNLGEAIAACDNINSVT
jgi:hypothetical protein